jgi:hypothetical protein
VEQKGKLRELSCGQTCGLEKLVGIISTHVEMEVERRLSETRLASAGRKLRS